MGRKRKGRPIRLIFAPYSNFYNLGGKIYTYRIKIEIWGYMKARKGDKMSFKRVEDDVREILEENTTARCDDMALYATYVFGKIKHLNCGKGWLQYIFSNRRYRIMHGIAPYETVSRVRRKLQEQNKDLRPGKEELEERKRIEKKYKEYARNGGGSK